MTETAATNELLAQLQAREAERGRALLAADVPALEALVHEDLVHVHASGMVEDRAQFLASVRGRLRFLRVERLDYRVRLASPDAAIATGRIRQCVQVVATGQEVDLQLFTTQVWVRSGAGPWRQLHFHATTQKT